MELGWRKVRRRGHGRAARRVWSDPRADRRRAWRARLPAARFRWPRIPRWMTPCRSAVVECLAHDVVVDRDAVQLEVLPLALETTLPEQRPCELARLDVEPVQVMVACEPLQRVIQSSAYSVADS